MISKLQQPEQKLFNTFTLLRFPLIVLVVFIHIIHEDITPVHLSLASKNLYHLIYTTISQNLGRVAVPCFFFISGYLFFMKTNSNFNSSVYLLQMKKRIKTLLIPYLFWNIAMVITILIKNFLSVKIINISADDLLLYIQQASFYEIIWKDPINYPLWYVRDLIMMIIISFLLAWLINNWKSYALILIGILYILGIESKIPGLSSTAIFFFSLGMYCSLYTKELVHVIQKYGIYIMISSIILLIGSLASIGSIFYENIIRLFCVHGVFAILYIGFKVENLSYISKKLINLSSTVFFIYALHVIYIINWSKGALFKLSFLNQGYGLTLGYFLTPTIIIGICLLLYYISKKTIPKILNLTVGGR